MHVLCRTNRPMSASNTWLKPVENAAPHILWKISDMALAAVKVFYPGTYVCTLNLYYESNYFPFNPPDTYCNVRSQQWWGNGSKPLQLCLALYQGASESAADYIIKSFPPRKNHYPCHVIYLAVMRKPLQLKAYAPQNSSWWQWTYNIWEVCVCMVLGF